MIRFPPPEPLKKTLVFSREKALYGAKFFSCLGETMGSLARLLGGTAFSVCLVYSQVDRANLNGTVTDTSGAVIPKALVEAVSRDTGLKRVTETGPAGTYNLAGLPIGSYDLTLFHEGFRAVKVNGIQLFVGQTRTVDSKLEVGAIESRVNVVGTAEALEQSNAQIDAVIETQQLRNIPINGRNWASLMTLAPGAINVGGEIKGAYVLSDARATTTTTRSTGSMPPGCRSSHKRRMPA